MDKKEAKNILTFVRYEFGAGQANSGFDNTTHWATIYYQGYHKIIYWINGMNDSNIPSEVLNATTDFFKDVLQLPASELTFKAVEINQQPNGNSCGCLSLFYSLLACQNLNDILEDRIQRNQLSEIEEINCFRRFAAQILWKHSKPVE